MGARPVCSFPLAFPRPARGPGGRARTPPRQMRRRGCCSGAGPEPRNAPHLSRRPPPGSYGAHRGGGSPRGRNVRPVGTAWVAIYGAATGTVGAITGAVALGINWRNALRDRARWHEARKPDDLTVTPSIETGGATVVSIAISDTPRLDRVTLTMRTEPGLVPQIAGLSRTLTGTPQTTVTIGPLRIGEPAKLYVWHSGPLAGAELGLQCACEIGREKWHLYRECELPAEHP